MSWVSEIFFQQIFSEATLPWSGLKAIPLVCFSLAA